MRSDEVVIEAPALDDFACCGQAEEDVLIQALVPQPAIEAFDEGVLHRLAG